MGGYFFNWDVIWRYSDRLINGLGLALAMAVVALLIGSIIGIAGALALTSNKRWLQLPVRAYVELIRNSPLLVLIFLVYFGLPQIGIRGFDNIGSFIATLAVYAGAYMTEVFRAGLASIPQRTVEAGIAIGLDHRQRLRYVILPMMWRVILPAMSNNLISLFKDTALASAIAVPELTNGARYINVQTFQIVEVWTSAAVLYLATSYVIALALRLLERRYAMIR